MEKIVFLLFIVFNISFAQNDKLSQLESKKYSIENQISQLEDSLKIIRKKINNIKLRTNNTNIDYTGLIAKFRKGAKMRTESSPYGDIIMIFSNADELSVIDYTDYAVRVCKQSKCGFVSKFYLSNRKELESLVNERISEQLKLNELEKQKEEKRKLEIKKEQELAEAKLKEQQRINEQDKKREKFIADKKAEEKRKNEAIAKFGKKTYEKLTKYRYWIGMTDEMALFSMGKPETINRTVNAYGVSEQWVYYKIYLYFDDGILTSFQD